MSCQVPRKFHGVLGQSVKCRGSPKPIGRSKEAGFAAAQKAALSWTVGRWTETLDCMSGGTYSPKETIHRDMQRLTSTASIQKRAMFFFVCQGGWLFGFLAFVAFTWVFVALWLFISHPLHSQFLSFRILCIASSAAAGGFLALWLLAAFWLWLFASSAFPVGFWPWLPASSASPV